jgi:dTMP kinase
MPRGRLIAFEGGEGSGKSTQAALLAEHLGAVLTREPGGTPLGETLREVVLHQDIDSFDSRAESFVMLAARAQHVAQVVAPEQARGKTVICDRFSHSTLAYQGYGRGLDLADLRRMCSWATRGIWPDLVVFLDVDPAVARARRGAPADRLEQAGEEFHRRVYQGFQEMAAEDTRGWLVVPGTGTVEEVAALVRTGYNQWAGIRPTTPRPPWEL